MIVCFFCVVLVLVVVGGGGGGEGFRAISVSLSFSLLTSRLLATLFGQGFTRAQCYSPLDAPVFTVVPSNITADEGDSVTLSCRASSTDKPQITWMLKDSSGVVTNIVPTPSIQVDPTGDLMYTSVKSDNRGQHICKACNVAGCKRVDAFLDVFCE